MSHVSKEEWKPQGLDLEPNAMKMLRESECSVLITASAGSGKTEFLAQKATYLLQTGICPAPKRILAISFKRDAARNLAERVAMRCPIDQARRFDSMTFDAFTKGLWNRFRSGLPKPYNSSRPYKIVMPTSRDYEAFLNSHNFNTVNVGTFIHNLSLTDLPIISSNDSNKNAIREYWDEQFNEANNEILLSFLMINRLIKLLLQHNSYICKALQITYPFVFLDEFQDTTYAQYDLLTNVFNKKCTIFTAVGDDKQRIMGWAGAMPDSFEQFNNDFKPKRTSLLLNWRAHNELVHIQHKIACKINPSTEQVQAKGIRSIEGNISAIWSFQTARQENEYLAKWIKNEIELNNINANDFAILVRYNVDKVEEKISTAFKRQNIKIRNVNRLVGEITIQDLLNEELTRIFIPLLRLGVTERSPKNWELAQKNQQFLDSIESNNILVLQKRQDKLGKFIQQLKIELENRPPNAISSDEIAKLLLEFVTQAALQHAFPAYHRETDFKRVWIGFVTFLQKCAEHSNSWEETLNEFEGVDQVTLMTIHKSKGLEFHTIIFYGLDNSTWKSLAKNNPEELNAFFVAFTRARQRAFFSRCRTDGCSINWIEKLLHSAGVRTIDRTTILN